MMESVTTPSIPSGMAYSTERMRPPHATPTPKILRGDSAVFHASDNRRNLHEVEPRQGDQINLLHALASISMNTHWMGRWSYSRRAVAIALWPVCMIKEMRGLLKKNLTD